MTSYGDCDNACGSEAEATWHVSIIPFDAVSEGPAARYQFCSQECMSEFLLATA